MVQVIYGDVLLLIDFCIDFFVLYTTGIFLRRSIKAVCITAAALIGGIYSVAEVFINGNDVIDFFISIAVGLLMCYISFGSYKFIKTVFVFFGTAAMIGGIMFAVYFFLGSYHYSIFGNMRGYAYSHIPLWLFVLLAILSLAISWMFSHIGRERGEKKEINAKVFRGGKSVTVRLLLDSGNLVKEPISGKNVVIIDIKAAEKLFSMDEYIALLNGESEFLLKRRFRIISAYGIEGVKRTYFAFLPEKLILFDENNEYECDAYIAVFNAADFFEKNDGIANPVIIT